MNSHKVFFSIFLFLLLNTAPSHSEAKTLAVAPVTTFLDQAAVEKRVREYFVDTPVMIEIARCESEFRQFTDDKSVLRGGDSGGMVGVFQFFESIHVENAKALGYDILSLEGNLEYAKHIYNQEGTAPWNTAKACWDTKTIDTIPTRAELEVKIKQLTQIITLLQTILELRSAR